MEPAIGDLRSIPKPEAYARLEVLAQSVLEGIDDPISGMATFSCLLHHAFGHVWSGFYRVVEPERLLRVGPYQGTLGCLEIPFGKGVCGTAAASRTTQVVPDVNAFPGHIACDSRSASEIVVPIFDVSGALIAVLDLDASLPGVFDEQDRVGLERLMRWFARPRSG